MSSLKHVLLYTDDFRMQSVTCQDLDLALSQGTGKCQGVDLKSSNL